MKHSITVSAMIALTGGCLPFGGLLLSQPVAAAPTIEEANAAPLWGEDIPAPIRAAALEADAVLDETPCDWRPVLTPLFRPVVANCASVREATLAIASQLGALTDVRYDTSRRHPCMNALEALAEKKVSCTGNSILLVCALRSVGIPARAVGVWTWNHVPGNHTWVEAWFEGEWHMVEAHEKAFNTPWVMAAIGMLHPAQRVLAAQPGGTHRFPTVWNPEAGIGAEDVTARYHALARSWYAQHGVPEDCQKLMVDILPRSAQPRTLLLEDEQGRELARATLPTTQDDMRQFATLLRPRAKLCFLRMEGYIERYKLPINESTVQLLLLRPRQP